MRSANVLGMRSDAATLRDAAAAVVDRARSGLGGYACLCNVHVLVLAGRDDAVATALEDAWAVFADGAPLAWLQRRDGADGAERVAGTELLDHVLASGSTVGIRHFFYGSTPLVVNALARRAAEAHPDARVVGAFAPPFGEEDLHLDVIREARPDVVWCGLGAPKQELWMRRHAPSLAPSVLVGVGAAFDFVAGTKARAPRWMQRTGLEWLHRLVTEPRRLAGRYITTNAEFAVRALRYLAGRR